MDIQNRFYMVKGILVGSGKDHVMGKSSELVSNLHDRPLLSLLGTPETT